VFIVQGLAPVRYQWFRDSKRLTVATSNTPLLVLVDVAAADSGTYHCQVTNKDGSVSSSRALLTVNRVGRLQAVTASMAEGAGGTPEPSSSAAIQGVSDSL
jgi:Meckel syndrome type 1 protein